MFDGGISLPHPFTDAAIIRLIPQTWQFSQVIVSRLVNQLSPHIAGIASLQTGQYSAWKQWQWYRTCCSCPTWWHHCTFCAQIQQTRKFTNNAAKVQRFRKLLWVLKKLKAHKNTEYSSITKHSITFICLAHDLTLCSNLLTAYWAYSITLTVTAAEACCWQKIYLFTANFLSWILWSLNGYPSVF